MATTTPRPSGRQTGPFDGLVRRRDDRIVAGVAAGIGDRFGVDPVVVRLAFIVLTLASGTGVLLYLIGWVVLPEDRMGRPTGVRHRPTQGIEQAVAVGLITVGSLLLLRSIGLWFPDHLVWPAAVLAVGFGLVWARTDDAERGRWRARAGRLPGDPVASLGGGRAVVLRLVGGVVLLFVGLGTFVAANERFAAAGQVAMAVLAAGVGAALLLGPWVVRLFRELGDERRERIRSEERAEMAAHLHDSVLQTLALIQRQANSPQDTVSLARRQERELRAWLYGEPGAAGAADTLNGAFVALVDEVEADHPVTVDLVTVGDAPIDDKTRALVAATREAVVNAAKHAAVNEVSVFAEIEPEHIIVYVRDRGRGFDWASVNGDRQGIAESIVGRMVRHGGKASILSAPGDGTEVTLEMNRGTEK